jgi:hypothetical protein
VWLSHLRHGSEGESTLCFGAERPNRTGHEFLNGVFTWLDGLLQSNPATTKWLAALR